MMVLAETLTALGDTDAALKIWQQVAAGASHTPVRRFNWPSYTLPKTSRNWRGRN